MLQTMVSAHFTSHLGKVKATTASGDLFLSFFLSSLFRFSCETKNKNTLKTKDKLKTVQWFNCLQILSQVGTDLFSSFQPVLLGFIFSFLLIFFFFLYLLTQDTVNETTGKTTTVTSENDRDMKNKMDDIKSTSKLPDVKETMSSSSSSPPKVRKLSLISNNSLSLPPLSPCLINVLDEPDTSKLYDLFKQVDTDHSGYIGLDEVRDICSKFGSNDEECNLIFQHLDKDGDGLVSFDDFSAGFNEYKLQLTTFTTEQINDENVNDKKSAKLSISSLTSDTGIGSCDSVTSEFGEVKLRTKKSKNNTLDSNQFLYNSQDKSIEGESFFFFFFDHKLNFKLKKSRRSN